MVATSLKKKKPLSVLVLYCSIKGKYSQGTFGWSLRSPLSCQDRDLNQRLSNYKQLLFKCWATEGLKHLKQRPLTTLCSILLFRFTCDQKAPPTTLEPEWDPRKLFCCDDHPSVHAVEHQLSAADSLYRSLFNKSPVSAVTTWKASVPEEI